jgi:hypothetical protein
VAEPNNTSTADKQRAALWLARLAPVFALIALALLVYACRGAMFNNSPLFNPDEAELLAAGRRATLGLQPYGDYTTPTFLFLWPLVLSLFSAAGFSLTLSFAHVLAAAAYVWIAFVAWFGVSRYMGWMRGALLTLPTTIYLFAAIPAPNLTGGVYDFLSLGTELLPLSLLMGACLILITGTGVPRLRRVFLATAVAGLAVWAKPQSTLLALTLVALAPLMRAALLDRGWNAPSARGLFKDLAVACAGFALPSILIVLWIAIGQTLDDFISEPARFNWTYLTERETLTGAPQITLLERFEPLGIFILSYPLALIWSLAGLAGVVAVMASRGRAAAAAAAAVWIIPMLAGAATVFFTFPLFPHYANVLYGGGAIAAVLGSRLATGADPDRSRRSATWIPLALVGVISALAVASAAGGPIYRNIDALANPAPMAPAASVDQLAQACPTGSSVLVWGTAFELYAGYDWIPASRYLGPGWILQNTKLQGTYRDRLATELKQQPPTCIVEALGPKFTTPGWTTKTESLKARLPDLTPLLNRCYANRSITIPDGRPVRLYVWNNRCPAPRT